MGLLYSGKDVRIEDGPIVWVCERKGWWHKTEQWKQVDVRDLDIHVRFITEFKSPLGVHSIRDLSIDLRELSRLLGIGRGDCEGAERIQKDPSSVCGAFWCINESMREIASNASCSVYPFSSVEFIGIKPKLHFQTRGRGEYSAVYIGDFPWAPEKIAEVVGVPLIA